jgi:uncharacterized membrane protein YbaN (DUF454 family)
MASWPITRQDGSVRRPLDLLRRATWILAGLTCVAVGSIGIIVPGLPTTVFFIAAAWCFARSSPRLEQWVLGLPKIGPAVRRYRAGLGMPRRAKYWAIGSIVVFSTISAVVVGMLTFTIVVLAVAAIGVWYVGWRVPTTPDDALDAANA